MNTSIISRARKQFHADLTSSDGPLCLLKDGDQFCMASNADRSQTTSKAVSLSIAKQLGAAPRLSKPQGQTMGKLFEQAVRDFLQTCLPHLYHVRPGPWRVANVGGNRREDQLAKYYPYRHLDDLAHAVDENPGLLAVLGNLYMVSPDVLVIRDALSDDAINKTENVVDGFSATYSPVRATNVPASSNSEPAFIHAVISCKWTMRSDRAQNTRSEALNLIRNRKGRTPHIVAVTAEPSISRIASIALGTGDIDTTYHFALPELITAVKETCNDEALLMLDTLVTGDRLRDISDLP
ncbi:MAG: NgoMIV family type II restriction endonuclease, partial [Mixta calida]|nr:NgoMIV family type II restriction endonuclease [Mixta calida]